MKNIQPAKLETGFYSIKTYRLPNGSVGDEILLPSNDPRGKVESYVVNHVREVEKMREGLIELMRRDSDVLCVETHIKVKLD